MFKIVSIRGVHRPAIAAVRPEYFFFDESGMPGVIDTAMNSHLSGDDLKTLAESTPLMRLGTPEEVAQAVYFLASDSASFITGQVLCPNGGFVM